jgi:hypothetical protein
LLKFSDARNFARTSTGLLLIAGPAILTLASIISPNTDHDNKLKELAAVAAHKGTYVLSGLLFLLATVLLMYAGWGVVRLFRGPRGVTLGQVGGVLLSLGAMVGAGWYAFGVLEYEMVNHKGLDRVALATYLHKANDSSLLLPLIIMFGVGVVIGTILIGVAAIRTRIVPVWAAVVIIVSGAAGFFSNGKAGGIISGVVLLVGFGALGLRALQMTDEEWDQPRERKAAPVAPEAPPAPAPAA